MFQGGLSGAELLRLLCCEFVQYSNPSPPTPTASRLTVSDPGDQGRLLLPWETLTELQPCARQDCKYGGRQRPGRMAPLPGAYTGDREQGRVTHSPGLVPGKAEGTGLVTATQRGRVKLFTIYLFPWGLTGMATRSEFSKDRG